MRYQKRLTRSLGIVLLILLTACNLPDPSTVPDTDAPIHPTKTSPPQPTATPPLAADTTTYRVQFRITSTSDWASLRLLSGGNWYQVEILSASEEADAPSFVDNALSISQDVGQANQGHEVVLTAEALLAHLDPGQPLIFEIERGYIGSSQVEILRSEEETFSPVTTLTWERGSSADLSTEVFEVSALPFLGSAPNEYIVISQLNFWYFGPGEFGGFENPDGSPSTPFTPLYGETYYSEDPDWVYQQIEWAVEYGVDAFSIEWDGPGDESLGVPMEKIVEDVFLNSPNIHKVRWAIFYDFILRMEYFREDGVDLSVPFNFSDPVIANTFVNDFVHFATKFFDHPQYLKIDGRPVVYIWATHAFDNNMAAAVTEARARVAELGYDVYIVGDEVCYGCFNPAHVQLFDATTTFTFLIPGVDHNSLQNVGQAAGAADTAFQWWRNRITDIKVVGREDNVVFQPGWAPQYDESWINDRPQPMVVQAESREQVVQMAEVNRKHAEPAGEEGLQLIWVNTWNCWGEGTTIEPTIEEGPKYPGGNYGFDMLEVIRDVYGMETYYTSP